MSVSQGADSAPKTAKEFEEDGFSPEIAALLAETFANMDRRARENAKRKPKTEAQRKRDAVKARLRSCAKGIDDLAADLERVHGGKSGIWHHAELPLFEWRMRGTHYRPKLLDQFERIEREAGEGCELSAAFVARYGPLLRLCEHMRHIRPPPRATDYDPLESLTPQQRARIKGAG